MKVFVCSGNHDDPLRLAANEKLMSRLDIFINRPFSAEEPLRVEKFGDIDIAYIEGSGELDLTGDDALTSVGEEG